MKFIFYDLGSIYLTYCKRITTYGHSSQSGFAYTLKQSDWRRTKRTSFGVNDWQCFFYNVDLPAVLQGISTFHDSILGAGQMCDFADWKKTLVISKKHQTARF